MEGNGNGHGLGGGAVPILGQHKARAGAQAIASFVRKLDENGTYEVASVVNTPAGPVGVPHRSDFLDAEELVAVILRGVESVVRAVVREELGQWVEDQQQWVANPEPPTDALDAESESLTLEDRFAQNRALAERYGMPAEDE